MKTTSGRAPGGRKKTACPSHDNLERWLISYADFITLMFAFFVVLFAASELDPQKARRLAGAFTESFKDPGLHATTANLIPAVQVVPALDLMIVKPPAAAEEDPAVREAGEKMRKMSTEIRETLAPLIAKDEIRVGDTADGLQIDIAAKLLFPPGQATLDPAALPALRSVATVIAAPTFPIKVEGHTDDTPIATERFPSNWELSAGRAAQVVRVLLAEGVAASRLTAAGYAEHRPVADNGTPAGKERNRRVAITIEMPRVKAGTAALGLGSAPSAAGFLPGLGLPGGGR